MSDGGKGSKARPFGVEFDKYRRKYRDWETDRKSTRLNSSH